MYNNNVVLINFTGVFISCTLRTLKVASVHKRGTLRHARARSRHALARTFLLARMAVDVCTRPELTNCRPLKFDLEFSSIVVSSNRVCIMPTLATISVETIP